MATCWTNSAQKYVISGIILEAQIKDGIDRK